MCYAKTVFEIRVIFKSSFKLSVPGLIRSPFAYTGYVCSSIRTTCSKDGEIVLVLLKMTASDNWAQIADSYHYFASVYLEQDRIIILLSILPVISTLNTIAVWCLMIFQNGYWNNDFIQPTQTRLPKSSKLNFCISSVSPVLLFIYNKLLLFVCTFFYYILIKKFA